MVYEAESQCVFCSLPILDLPGRVEISWLWSRLTRPELWSYTQTSKLTFDGVSCSSHLPLSRWRTRVKQGDTIVMRAHMRYMSYIPPCNGLRI
ncbi:hypothetical protein VFPPC_15776 [Pochonia chlamydosporia 170]|uniref:Uncharacterized protein n=1 Tax=Pochonia chlamydosporia 170 TaxID=1380566 RepID=A0A179FS82_METCM|nr:hypothetical protein VFPPC_15776 [Pochonia chlamydosporia 170]OAQ68060.1 hypothetical protein VFPPC_15776 [Pochonia chlamydosporia 170]